MTAKQCQHCGATVELDDCMIYEQTARWVYDRTVCHSQVFIYDYECRECLHIAYSYQTIAQYRPPLTWNARRGDYTR